MNHGENSLTQRLWFRGAIASLIIGSSLVILGRDSLYFYNGPGGNNWKIGQGEVHVFNAHFERDLDRARQKALALANRDRRANGLPPLAADSRLAATAQQHAEDMAERGYFSDFSPEGQAPSDRFTQLGGQGFVAQNIAVREAQDSITYNQLSLIEREFMYDRRDRENLLNPQFNQFGYGLAISNDGEGLYAVQVFHSNGPALVVPPGKPPSTNASATTTEAALGSDPFRDAVNAAMAAAVATQSAQTPSQWAAIAQQWQTAVRQMQAVDPSHPRHATAQQKVQEYSNNFNYARQNAGDTFATASVPAQATSPSAGEEGSRAAALMADLPATQVLNDTEQWIQQPEAEGQILKILLTLGGAAGLILLFTFDPIQRRGDKPGKPADHRDRRPWHRQAIAEVQSFLETKGWFNSTPQYKLTAAQSAQRVNRKLYRQLLNLTQNEQAAIERIKDQLRRNPRKPANWCCEQAIRELQRTARTAASAPSKPMPRRRTT